MKTEKEENICTENHCHEESCGCGEYHDHEESCGCGAHYDHEESCGCGERHDHEESCGCGEHHHEEHRAKEVKTNNSFEQTKDVKIYLKGLNCANCASKIENDTIVLSSVESLKINLLKQEMSLKTDKECNTEKLLKQFKEIVAKYEPDVAVSMEETEEEEFDLKKRLVKYSIGAAIFVMGVALPVSEILKNSFMIIAYLIFGLDVLIRAAKNISRGQVFDENFLMSISTIGAFAIGEMPEAVFVMLFYQVGETFQEFAVGRSRKSIKELMNIKPEFANVMRNGALISVEPEEVKIGETIIIKPGEKIPLDGIVTEGHSQLDTVALTGESVPREAVEGDEVLNGSINLNGLLTVKVTKEFSQSTVVKILEMVENASSKKSETEQFITKFAKIYTPAVVALAVLLAFVPPMVTPESDLTLWFGRALIFLVVSCPCALVLSVPLGFFSGIGAASKRGVLVKGSNYIQALSMVDTVVFDKTGTATEGVFKVNKFEIENNFDKDMILQAVYVCEKMSNHPIAKSITEYCLENNVSENNEVSDYEEIRGYGVKAKLKGKNIIVGNGKLMETHNVKYNAYDGLGSVVYIAVGGKYAGMIAVSDKIKDDTKTAVEKFKSLGIKDIVMLTGDNKREAEKVSKEIGINKFYAELLPQNKVEKIEELYEENKDRKIAFVGDGINDAPVLSRVDVGIAMGGVGSDAAIEAADVVIMNDSLFKVAEGIVISRKTRSIVKQNITFALLVKAVVLVLSAIGMTSMWLAVFADVGVSFICILNSMRKKI